MKLLNDIKLTKNFYMSEFSCDDQVMLDMKLVEELQKLRDFIGKPLTVTSGYRTPERNKTIGGSSKSKHMEGIAADIYGPVAQGRAPGAFAGTSSVRDQAG